MAAAMTRDEQTAYITQCFDTLKRSLLERAERIPPHWDCAEIQQWILDTARELPITLKMDAARLRRYQMTRQVKRI
jgi:hypothetical protein